MRLSISAACGVVVCLAIYGALAGEAQVATDQRHGEHASVAAYPGSVVSLKDPQSGFLYYVESNGRRLVAFDKEGAVKWSTDVFDAGKFTPSTGAAVIREMSVRDGTLWITCGKHSWAKVNLKSGKVEFAGSD